MSDTPLKSTTRHVRIFAATVEEDGSLTASSNQLTLDLDPDNEFEWEEAAVGKVQQRFRELVKAASGTALNDYNLNRIGTELEGLMRQMLQAGELRYNLGARVLNYSMGLPRTPETL
ncbi:MAG: NAD(P)H-quinone oxidoreductase subunit M [Synechococcus sp.]|nr:NAD(P)H-quinone oxidoreductase subunit M [Synechococcus sp.]